MTIGDSSFVNHVEDDIVVFGFAATAAVVIGVGAYLSKKKTKIPPPP